MSPTRLLRQIPRFAALEASAGLVLLAATVAALLWANRAGTSYEEFWGHVVDVGPLDQSLLHIVNDGLMPIFFLVVGLEVKRELTIGELAGRQAALLPLFAATGGMILPAVIFLAVMHGEPGSSGWGIPMATDVAFAVGAMAALGSRVPPGLVAVLLGVAVIDDIGAILVIAIYYTDGVALGWLALALGTLAAMPLLRRAGLRHPAAFVALGLVVWFATYESGVHATIAGVAVGLVTPVHPRPGSPPGSPSALERAENLLHGPSSYVVLPVFALANAGIVLDRQALEAATQTPVALAVALGLVVGKTIGLTAGAALAVRLGLSARPDGVSWLHILGMGALAGIGFTVSLFIAGLAYGGTATEDAAKIGILGGSVVAAALGFVLLAVAGRRRAVSP